MTESDSGFTRSGLDMPEGSANADKVEETGIVDTNADDHREPVDSGETEPPPEGGEGEGEELPPETQAQQQPAQ